MLSTCLQYSWGNFLYLHLCTIAFIQFHDRVIAALLVSSYSTSLIIGLCLVVLGFVGCLKCKDGKDSIMCYQCGTKKPNSDEKYKCNSLDAVLVGYSKPVVWLVFSAFQIGKAVEVFTHYVCQL
jgi:di/tricarboxylate transporter